jgi:hypothetical protein
MRGQTTKNGHRRYRNTGSGGVTVHREIHNLGRLGNLYYDSLSGL